jgi:tripartite-type tricarboxylate transporter receptor subunit TctC
MKRAVACLVGALVAGPAVVMADDYPSRPVKAIVAFGAGGQVDVMTRVVGQRLREVWGQPLVVENRPGAGGNLSAEIAARAPADGYTLYFVTQAFAVNAAANPSKAFDAVKDLTPVALLGTARAVLLVSPSSPIHSVADLLAYAKAHPGESTFASTSVGAPAHVGMELFKSMTGLEAQHVPYVNVGHIVPDVMSGRITMWLTTLASTLANIQTGQMRALAVSGKERMAALPDVPTFAEAGYPTFESSTWYAVLVPTGTPQEIIDKINRDVDAAVETPAVRDKLDPLGSEPVRLSAEETKAFVHEDIERWRGLVRRGVLKPMNEAK